MANQPQVQLPPVEVTAGGETEDLRVANLQAAQAIPGFADVILLIADAIVKRAEQVMLDFTQQSVGMKYQIDGFWHDLPPRDRQSGDAMLASLKCLANCDPRERRARQSGNFKVRFLKVKGGCAVTSQGVKTGERAILDFECNRQPLERLEELGMREAMRTRFKELSDASQGGILIVSAPPKGGLTTSWTACLNECDRFMRDFACLQSAQYSDPEILNVAPNVYDPAAGKPYKLTLDKLILRQPEVLVVPELDNTEIANSLVDQAADHGRLVITRIHAKSADEALLRFLMLKPDAEKFAKSMLGVLNARPTRMLCDNCKQPYKPSPQMLQRMGLPPGRIDVFYRPWTPPPDPPLDKNGKPIPIPICPNCQGLGYCGRTGIFEFLTMDDQIRAALKGKPNLQTLRTIVKRSGHHTLQDQGILLVCQGITSLEELQRVMK